MSERRPERVPLPLQWANLEQVPVVFANQFLGQVIQSGEIVLTCGQVTPPVILEGQGELPTQLPPAQVSPVARLALTPQRTRELIGILEQTLHNHEQIQRMEEADGGV